MSQSIAVVHSCEASTIGKSAPISKSELTVPCTIGVKHFDTEEKNYMVFLFS